MADLVLVAVIVAFTALCVAYISWCDRIIGPDDRQRPRTDEPEAVSA